MKGDEFYAFEDKRSIQVKTIWTSLNRYGGIALQGIEMDNPAGQCPAGEPYPLLRTIVKTQVRMVFSAVKKTSSSCFFSFGVTHNSLFSSTEIVLFAF